MTPTTEQAPDEPKSDQPDGIDFESDAPIANCPLRRPEDGEICESCQ
jgi:hypothetical protein